MENHPIPQDVTGFQFKLIGNMTVKQFGYLATGGVLAVIFYYAPIFLPIKIVLIPLFILSGISFAFLPVEGRPLDMMVSYYFKALFSPNQYVYKKVGAHLAISTLILHRALLPIKQPVQKTKEQQSKIPPSPTQRKAQLTTFLSHLPKHQVTKFDEKEEAYLHSLFSRISLIPTAQELQQIQFPSLPIVPDNESQAPSRVITAEILEDRTAPVTYDDEIKEDKATQGTPLRPADAKAMAGKQDFAEQVEDTGSTEGTESAKETTLEKKTDDLEKQLAEAQQEEKNAQTEKEAEINHKKVLDLESQMQDILRQKQKLEDELLELKKELAKKDIATVTPGELQQIEPKIPQPAAESQFVHKIPKSLAKAKGVPLTPDSPNMIAGVVKDARENVLANILVEVKDKEGNPIRAFKTNQFGQFSSATPLQSGEYRVDLEDPRGKHTFDSIELIARGDILLPLEILSNDAREALRKELFS